MDMFTLLQVLFAGASALFLLLFVVGLLWMRLRQWRAQRQAHRAKAPSSQ
ncbi:hypothetical protein [Magnetococcus marinus]|nr:hypothetical protein [Magnetococcus marinus]